MDSKYVDYLKMYLSNIDDFVFKNFKNGIEKNNILTKIEELVFWLEQYKSQNS